MSQLHRFDDALRDADALVALPSATINKPGYINNNGDIEDFHVVALTNRAALKLKMGRTAEAEADFDSAVATAPASEPLLVRGEYRLTQPGQAESALRDFDAAAALNSDDYGAQFDRGKALQMLKRYPAALEAFGRASALQPRTGMALMMRARVLRALGRRDDAVRDYEKAMALDPWTRLVATNAFVAAGYLSADRRADAAPAAMHAATQACMLDTDCN